MTAKKTTTSSSSKTAKAKKGVATGPVRAFRQKLDYPVIAANTVDSYTGRKRVRMSFGHIREVAMMPNLIEVQRSSYESFLQLNTVPAARKMQGLQGVFANFFPSKGL